jgi:hypothetical protein
MSVRITIDIPDDLHATLRRRAAVEQISIHSLVIDAIESQLKSYTSRQVTGPLIGKILRGKKNKPATASRDTKNPYDVLFA